MKSERELGKYFTQKNPFYLEPFKKWFLEIPEYQRQILLEPFAGSNNIPFLFQTVFPDANWESYDILPDENNLCPQYPIQLRDTLRDYPKAFSVVVTNPPFLSLTSASQRHIPYPNTALPDLYLYALKIMLENNSWAAVIVPDTFLLRNIFQERLYAVISLPIPGLFSNTHSPACLALFNPEPVEDTHLYINNKYCGTLHEVKCKLPSPSVHNKYTFNQIDGAVGIIANDNVWGPSIEFVPGAQINGRSVLGNSRAYIRVGMREQLPVPLADFIAQANEILNTLRHETNDFFLTSYRKIRKDGCFRKRITRDTISLILDATYEMLTKEQ